MSLIKLSSMKTQYELSEEAKNKLFQKKIDYDKLIKTLPNGIDVNTGIVKQASEKPDIFTHTIYRDATDNELEDVNKYNLKHEDIIKGFSYTIIGRGIKDSENKQTIINNITRLSDKYPKNLEYNKAMDKAKCL